MYKQMIGNPSIAISGMADSKWVRISGYAKMDDEQVKNEMLTEIPALKKVYNPEEFEVFSIEDMKATVYSFQDEPQELQF